MICRLYLSTNENISDWYIAKYFNITWTIYGTLRSNNTWKRKCMQRLTVFSLYKIIRRHLINLILWTKLMWREEWRPCGTTWSMSSCRPNCEHEKGLENSELEIMSLVGLNRISRWWSCCLQLWDLIMIKVTESSNNRSLMHEQRKKGKLGCKTLRGKKKGTKD